MPKMNRDLIKEATKGKHPLPVWVLISSVPATVILLPILWWLRYPPAEWPFVAGVFCLCLVGTGALISGVALLAVTRVDAYACTVACRQGIELHEPDTSSPGARVVGSILLIVTMLFLGMASWGLALYAVGVVTTMLAMPPLGNHLTEVCLTLLATGGVGFSLIMISFTWFFYSVDRHPRRIKRFSRRLRYWIRLSGQMTQGRLTGLPALAR